VTWATVALFTGAITFAEKPGCVRIPNEATKKKIKTAIVDKVVFGQTSLTELLDKVFQDHNMVPFLQYIQKHHLPVAFPTRDPDVLNDIDESEIASYLYHGLLRNPLLGELRCEYPILDDREKMEYGPGVILR
jgi:hypothetical protein